MELSTLVLFAAAAFVVAALVVATGFGLGTALTPLFLLIYDIKIAVLLVAVVHLANNLFKLALFRRHIDVAIVRRFGLWSIGGALAGSWLQLRTQTTGLEIGLGALLIVLGGLELLPGERPWRIPRRFDQAGGLGSGLLGGLLGNQGALRSAYLLNYKLGKEAFIASGTSIACLIDLTRIPVYLVNYHSGLLEAGPWLIAVIAAAFAGTFLGKRLVERLSLAWFRRLVAALIVLTGAALVATNF